MAGPGEAIALGPAQAGAVPPDPEGPTMGFTAASYDAFLWRAERRGMRARRASVLADANGRTLEIGAGTGLNLRHYPDAVGELVLTEPVDAMSARLHRRAEGDQPAAARARPA